MRINTICESCENLRNIAIGLFMLILKLANEKQKERSLLREDNWLLRSDVRKFT